MTQFDLWHIGAWVLTGGNNDGVMKYVGEAVDMLQSSRKVVAFGIAPWGCVANKRELSSVEVSYCYFINTWAFAPIPLGSY